MKNKDMSVEVLTFVENERQKLALDGIYIPEKKNDIRLTEILSCCSTQYSTVQSTIIIVINRVL
jgi:hypothetical protein